MKRLSTFVLPLLVAASLAACKSKQNEAQDAAQEAPASAAPVANEAAAGAPAAPVAPATPTSASAASASKFDPQTIPVSDKALPAFPYLATPSGLEAKSVYTEKDLEFDRVFVVAGEELRPVEGKVFQRKFFLHELKWSPLAAHRNYENALKALGAVRVDKVHPHDDAFVERNGGDSNAMWRKMGTPSLDRVDDPEAPGYEQWLLRTPTTNIWLSFFIDQGQVYLQTVEEKAMQQQV